MKNIIAAFILHGYRIIYTGHDTTLFDFKKIDSAGLMMNAIVIKETITLHRMSGPFSSVYAVNQGSKFYADLLCFKELGDIQKKKP